MLVVTPGIGEGHLVERQEPSTRWPSTSLVPVHPFGVRNTTSARPSSHRSPTAVRASCWMSRISSRQWSSVAARAWCISFGSDPSTTYGV